MCSVPLPAHAVECDECGQKLADTVEPHELQAELTRELVRLRRTLAPLAIGTVAMVGINALLFRGWFVFFAMAPLAGLARNATRYRAVRRKLAALQASVPSAAPYRDAGR